MCQTYNHTKSESMKIYNQMLTIAMLTIAMLTIAMPTNVELTILELCVLHTEGITSY